MGKHDPTRARMGAMSIEYGLMAALISVASIMAMEAEFPIVAGVFLVGAIVCSRRFGQLIRIQLRQQGARRAALD